MNIKDLTLINIEDLKNIDIEQLKQTLKSRPDLVIIIAMTLLTIFGLAGIFNYYHGTSNQLKMKIKALEGKQTTLKEQKEFQDEYNVLIKNFPKSLPSIQIIDKISELANKRGIKILSFSPAKEKDQELWSVTSHSINISSNDFKNIVLFINDIENSDYLLRVEKWSAKISQQKSGESRDYLMDAQVDIGSITLK